jgi:preprotein translocase subunit YajC
MSVLMAVMAQATPTATPSITDSVMQMLPMILMIVVIFYFLIYRPQKQQREKHKQMLDELKKGDKVVTTGGIWGTVTNLGKATVTLQVAENAKIKVAREHVARIRGEDND